MQLTTMMVPEEGVVVEVVVVVVAGVCSTVPNLVVVEEGRLLPLGLNSVMHPSIMVV